MKAKEVVRCEWAKGEEYERYHDEEWGVPVHEDRKLFEFLVLESAQAGLSWLTILRKREAYRKAFAQFDPEVVARYGAREKKRLLADAGIVRNRLKIDATIANAKAFLKVQEEFGTFDAYIWRFVDGQPLQNERRTIQEIPPRTVISDEMSKDLKQRGFKFVGSTIMYAHMQATGMVNDHIMGCWRYETVRRIRKVESARV
ncbi:MAG: DNA-3-methyladenine glycosylase I [Phycisphaerales bacterium]|nr:DNA-3-methyladenine glycosylase I [Phycisphaerales bacterium]